MDQHTFDRLTRAVAAGQNRRAFLRRLFGVGAAVAVSGGAAERAMAAPITSPGTPNSTVPLQEPTEPTAPQNSSVGQSQTESAAICLEPLVATDCGCLDPATQTCCQDDICTGECTAKDGCCTVSADKTVAERGEVCGDHCCHPHLDPAHADYSECCDNSCCAGHCYGESSAARSISSAPARTAISAAPRTSDVVGRERRATLASPAAMEAAAVSRIAPSKLAPAM